MAVDKIVLNLANLTGNIWTITREVAAHIESRRASRRGQNSNDACVILSQAMGPRANPDITRLLREWKRGDGKAAEELAAALYDELRHTARRYMRQERHGHTLQTTAVVHEAFLRLAGVRMSFRDRTHFFAFAAQLMRRVLVDHARTHGYRKRGDGVKPIPLEEGAFAVPDRSSEIIALDEALSGLDKHDPRKARVVELRFFGGLTVEETAAALSVSTQTVLRDWNLAKAWLTRELTHAGRF